MKPSRYSDDLAPAKPEDGTTEVDGAMTAIPATCPKCEFDKFLPDEDPDYVFCLGQWGSVFVGTVTDEQPKPWAGPAIRPIDPMEESYARWAAAGIKLSRAKGPPRKKRVA